MGGETIDPYIGVNYMSGATGQVAMVIFEWSDLNKIGKVDPSTGDMIYLCDASAVNDGLCTSTQQGRFLLNTENGTTDGTSIYSEGISFLQSSPAVGNNDNNNDTLNGLSDAHPVKYTVNSTGYYCVSVAPVGNTAWTAHYDAVVEFRNAYGELPGSDYPKLLFYGALSIIYLIIGALWIVVCAMQWKELLPIQNYLSGIIVFTMIEMAFNWGYYDYLNVYGPNNVSHALLGWVSILNAGRNSLSFFVLLIVCMGYGVVVETLGRTMWKCRLLAMAHFVFGVAYSIGATLMPPEEAGLVVLFVIFPLAFTMTAFYVWTLSSLQQTIADLNKRRQTVKATMYKRLYRTLLFSVVVLGIFFVFNSVTFSGRLDPSWAAKNWQRRWLLLDGWLNLLYLIILSTIAFLWRPTRNNRRFAMSDEIAQDDLDDFELPTREGGSDEDDDEYIKRINGERQNGRSNPQGNVADDGLVFDIGDDDDDEEDKKSEDGKEHFHDAEGDDEERAGLASNRH